MENTDAQRKNHQELDSVNLLTNSVGSLVRIDELYVGIDDVYSPDSNGRWGHFSIRGYVAEMRKRNKRICAPFETEDESLLEEQLLPIEVRKFRYWRCKDCILGNCSKRPTGEFDLVSESPQNGVILEGTCPNMTSRDNAGATKCAGCGSENSKNQIVDGGHLSTLLPTIVKRGVCSETASPNLSGIELVERTRQCITGPESRDMCYPIAGVCLNKKTNVSELELGVTLPCDKVIYDAANCSETEAGLDANKSTKSPSIQAEDQDDVSTESDEALIRSIDHRRKTKKVRLLTDLLSGKGNKRGDMTIEDSSVASHGDGMVSAAEVRDLPEDVGKDNDRLATKRRMSQAENSNNLEIRGLTNVSKKVRSARVNVDRFNATRDVWRSEAQETLLSEPKHGKPLSSPIQVNDDQTGRGSHAPFAIDITASTDSGRREKDKGKRPVIGNCDTVLAPACGSTMGEVLFQRNQRESLQIVSTTRQYLSENETSTNVGLDLSLGSPVSSEATAKRNMFSANPTGVQPNYRPSYHCKGKNVAEDLSMLKYSSLSESGRKGLPWDLNERIGHNTSLSFDRQKNSAPFEYRDSATQGMMGFCNPSSKLRHAEVHGNSIPPNIQGYHRIGKAVEQVSSDDIPMELVGFLAEKQYEKKIQMEQGHSSREHHSMSNNKSGNSMGGHNKEPGNVPMTWFSRDVSGTARSSHANAIKGVVLAVDNRISGEGKSKFGAYKWSCQEADQRKLCSAVPENQQILSTSIQFPYTNSSIVGTRSSEVERPTWLSKNDSMPTAHRISQKYTSTLSGGNENQSRVELQHKGRTISDIKAEEVRMQNKKQQIANMSAIGELNQKSRSFSDQHSNEAIPAMQLLSLIQNGMSSDSAFDGNANRFVGKPFFPSNYQPRLSIDERSRSYNRPLLSNQHQRSVVGNAGPCLVPRPSSLFCHTSFRSQELGEPGSWAQLHQQVRRSGSLHMSQLPGSRIDGKHWDNLGSAYPLQFQHPGPGMERQNWDRQIGVSGSSLPMKFQLHSGRFESSPTIDLESFQAAGTASARRHSEEETQCVLNQNPAEFSSPEPGNEYTLSGGDIQLLHVPRPVNFTDGRGRRRRQRANTTRGRDQSRGHAS